MAQHACKSIQAASKFVDKFEELLSDENIGLSPGSLSSTLSNGGTSRFPQPCATPMFVGQPGNATIPSGRAREDDPFTCRAANSTTKNNVFHRGSSQKRASRKFSREDKENTPGVENDSSAVSINSTIAMSNKELGERKDARLEKVDEHTIKLRSGAVSPSSAEELCDNRKIIVTRLGNREEDLVSTGDKRAALDLPVVRSEEDTPGTLHLLSDTKASVIPEDRLAHECRRLENEKLKTEKQFLEEKLAHKSRVADLHMELDRSRKQLADIQAQHEAEVEVLTKRIKQSNERFCDRLAEKERECETRLKVEVEHTAAKTRAEMNALVAAKDADIAGLKAELKELRQEMEEQRKKEEMKLAQTRAGYEAKVQEQVKAQVAFEDDVLGRLSSEKEQEVRRIQEQFNLDLEYERYKLKKRGTGPSSAGSQKSAYY